MTLFNQNRKKKKLPFDSDVLLAKHNDSFLKKAITYGMLDLQM